MSEDDREIPENIEGGMCEIRDRLKLLESALETRVDAMVSPDSKLPNNCMGLPYWPRLEIDGAQPFGI